MPKQTRLHRRSSPVGFCVDDDDDNSALSSNSDDELIPEQMRRRDEPQSPRRLDYVIVLLLVAVIVSLAKSSSLSTLLWSPVTFGKQNRHSPTFWDEPRSLVDGPSMRDGTSCENLPPAKFITIRGERHSTTNLFRRVTDLNGRFQQQCGMFNKYIKRCDEVVGWKHGFFDPERDFVEENVIVAVLVRDAFSWLVSMFYEPYNMIMEEGTDNFGFFLRSSYVANECEVGDYYDGCSYPIESAENLIQLRTKKYRNWVHFLSSASSNSTYSRHRWSIVNSEELASDQEGTVKSFFKQHCIDTFKPEFEPVGKIVTNSKQSNHAEREEVLKEYTIDELRFVLDNIDRDFESRVLGYDYTYVEEHILKRSTGVLEYSGPPLLRDNILEKRLKLIQNNLDGKLPGRDIPYENVSKGFFKEIQMKLFPLHHGEKDST